MDGGAAKRWELTKLSVEGGSHRTLHNGLTTFLKSFLSQILKALILMLVPLASQNNAEQCSYCLVMIYFVKMHRQKFYFG